MEKRYRQLFDCGLELDCKGFVNPLQQQRTAPIISIYPDQRKNKQNKKSKFTGSCFLNELNSTKNKKRSLAWSADEDKLIFEKYLQIGSKWIEISDSLPHRSDNDVKNRFYCCVRKAQYHLVNIQKRRKLKSQKPISFNCLLTILEIGKGSSEFADKRFEHIKNNIASFLEARKLIIDLAKQQNAQIVQKIAEKLVQILLILKYALKFINSQRIKKSSKKKEISVIGTIEEQSQQLANNESKISEGKYKTKDIHQISQMQTLNEDLIDLQKISKQISRENRSQSLSLIQSCKDVLCFSIVSKQEFQNYFFS